MLSVGKHKELGDGALWSKQSTAACSVAPAACGNAGAKLKERVWGILGVCVHVPKNPEVLTFLSRSMTPV